MLQETHSTEHDIEKWKEEWGNDIFTSHGEGNSRGVGIFLYGKMEVEIHSQISDPNGRYIILDITIYDTRLTLGNVYGPNKDDPNFFLTVIDYIESCNNDNRIIGGDFNCI